MHKDPGKRRLRDRIRDLCSPKKRRTIQLREGSRVPSAKDPPGRGLRVHYGKLSEMWKAEN